MQNWPNVYILLLSMACFTKMFCLYSSFSFMLNYVFVPCILPWVDWITHVKHCIAFEWLWFKNFNQSENVYQDFFFIKSLKHWTYRWFSVRIIHKIAFKIKLQNSYMNQKGHAIIIKVLETTLSNSQTLTICHNLNVSSYFGHVNCISNDLNFFKTREIITKIPIFLSKKIQNLPWPLMSITNFFIFYVRWHICMGNILKSKQLVIVTY